MDSVLFVDDEINILNSLRRGLVDEDYECFFASSGKEALSFLDQHTVSVVVTDMRMPEMDGLALLKEIKKRWPKTVRVVLSGYTQHQQILATVNQVDIFKFITKPWNLEDEFKVVIRQAIEYYNLQINSEELKKSLESKNQAYQKILKNINDVVASAKHDVVASKQICMDILSYIEALMDSGLPAAEIKMEVLACKLLFLNMMSIAASEAKDVFIRDIIEPFFNELTGRKKIKKIDYSFGEHNEKLHIKPELISYMLKTMDELLFDAHEEYSVRVISAFRPGTDNPDVRQLELSFVITCLTKNNSAASQGMNKHIDKINKLFGDMLKLYSCSISVHRVDMNTGVKMLLQV